MKLAVTVIGVLPARVQVAVPAQPPLQLANTEPMAGVAARVTEVPAG